MDFDLFLSKFSFFLFFVSLLTKKFLLKNEKLIKKLNFLIAQLLIFYSLLISKCLCLTRIDFWLSFSGHFIKTESFIESINQ